jgi:hypothetical protein
VIVAVKGKVNLVILIAWDHITHLPLPFHCALKGSACQLLTSITYWRISLQSNHVELPIDYYLTLKNTCRVIVGRHIVEIKKYERVAKGRGTSYMLAFLS